MKYTKTLLALAATTALTISCSDKDYFDKEAYDNLITEAFPVENVDPNHDWKTVGSADVNITLMQSGEGYSVIRILYGEPGDENASVLAMDSIANGSTMTTSFNYPIDSTEVNVVVTDADGFSSVYPRTIENGTLTTTVGNAQTSTRTRAVVGATRASSVAGVTYDFAEDYNDGVYPTECPSDAKSLSSNYGSKILYVDNSSPDLSNLWNSDDYIYFPSGNYTLSGSINSWNGLSTLVLLHGAKVTFKEKALSLYNNGGLRIVVCEGATMSASNNPWSMNGISIYNAGDIYTYNQVNLDNGTEVYNRGTWTTLDNEHKADIQIDQKTSGSTSSQLVNDGTISIQGGLVLGGAFLNTDSLSAYSTTIKFTNTTESQNAWVNEGRFYVYGGDFDFDSGTKQSSQVINSCKLNIEKGDLSFNAQNVVFNNNARAYIYAKGSESRQGIIVQSSANLTLNLGDKSIIKCDNTIKINNTTVNGPTTDGASALILSNVFNGGLNSVSTAKLTGNILFGAKTWTNCGDITGGESYGHATSMLGLNVTIPATPCSPGYTGTYKPTYPNVEKASTVRYCYEDNYPSAGDYDFNDIVLDVTPVKNPSIIGNILSGIIAGVWTHQVAYTVQLTAVGATKQIAAAMRLKGIKATDIKDISYIDGNLYDFSANPTNSNIIKKKFDGDANTVITGKLAKDSNGDAIIYLFNDAHYAYTKDKGNDGKNTDGSLWRPFINTIRPAETTVDAQIWNPVSCTVVVTFKDGADAADEQWTTSTGHIDPFIITEYNGGYWEVHTTDYITSPALYDYNNSDDYSINLPWALCLPSSFKYPKEFTPIGNYKGGTLGGAYSKSGQSFGEWCTSKNDAKDWYNYPDADKVYK